MKNLQTTNPQLDPYILTPMRKIPFPEQRSPPIEDAPNTSPSTNSRTCLWTTAPKRFKPPNQRALTPPTPAPTERRIKKDTSPKQERDPPHRKRAPTVKPAPGATASTSALHQKPPSSNTTTTRALLTPPRIAPLLPTASKGRAGAFQS
jgi:hypothetical protein